MISDITYLGKVIRVDSNTVEVEISSAIPSAAPIINGRLYKIGQIGTFVKFPVGNISIYGIVSAVSNTPNAARDENRPYDPGSRFLSVQLVGEKIGDEDFQKGVGTYPTINDEVHLVTEGDLFDIYARKDAGSNRNWKALLIRKLECQCRHSQACLAPQRNSRVYRKWEVQHHCEYPEGNLGPVSRIKSHFGRPAWGVCLGVPEVAFIPDQRCNPSPLYSLLAYDI